VTGINNVQAKNVFTHGLFRSAAASTSRRAYRCGRFLHMSHVAWSVRACVCVCVCVGHEGSCSRTTEPIEMLFGGTRNLGLDGFFPPTGKGNFIGGFCGLLPESNPDECTGGCK